MKSKLTIGIIGGGNMGSAIAAGIKARYNVAVCEMDPKRRRLLKSKFSVKVAGFADLVKNCRVLILAVKPQDFEGVLSALKTYGGGADKLIISIAAGMTTKYIEKRLGQKVRVIRMMPNLPAQVQKGITAICRGRFASVADLKLAQKIFQGIGETVVIQEKMMDAVTAVSGSGPAYVFLFIECFMKAARSLGFDEATSQRLVMQTIEGSLSLMKERKEGADVLRERVTSKGGTTFAALEIFRKNGYPKIFQKALQSAKKRAKELSRG